MSSRMGPLKMTSFYHISHSFRVKINWDSDWYATIYRRKKQTKTTGDESKLCFPCWQAKKKKKKKPTKKRCITRTALSCRLDLWPSPVASLLHTLEEARRCARDGTWQTLAGSWTLRLPRWWEHDGLVPSLPLPSHSSDHPLHPVPTSSRFPRARLPALESKNRSRLQASSGCDMEVVGRPDGQLSSHRGPTKWNWVLVQQGEPCSGKLLEPTFSSTYQA